MLAGLCEGGNEPPGSLKVIRSGSRSVSSGSRERCDDDNNALTESALRISYKICHEIAKELKTFNEGEFIKRCLIILADELCPQQVGEVEAICLSRRTVVRRLQYTSQDSIREGLQPDLERKHQLSALELTIRQ
ncbi:hypothetical protein ANN_03617 [Periplaneta americana]|uniref:Uncharacterized protein n=1 Tax=Periplaneta americana TaxID=6978 RepID=A0ABQ8U2I6_PERAM|nr:hypothetical protein ANN_03617 [Periplaneta americana]